MLAKVLSVDTTTEIVSLEEATEHQRITDLWDELVVTGCVDAAIDAVQFWLNRKLYPTTIIGQEEHYSKEITLSYPKIKSVDPTITAEDMYMEAVTLVEGTDWVFDDIFGTIRFKPNISMIETYKNFRITYVCGYDPETDPVPPAVKHAILMTAATLYENREDTIVGTQINEVPLDSKRLIRTHRVRTAT